MGEVMVVMVVTGMVEVMVVISSKGSLRAMSFHPGFQLSR